MLPLQNSADRLLGLTLFILCICVSWSSLHSK